MAQILLGCIYRPHPRADRDEAILECLRAARELIDEHVYDSILVVGDFNLGDIEWRGGHGSALNAHSYEGRFLETLDDCFLCQCVNRPTFYHGVNDSSGSILDLIITDSDSRVLDIVHEEPLGNITTAHSVLLWKLAAGRVEKEIFRAKRRWRHGDYVGMSVELLELDWREIFSDRSLDDLLDVC